MSQNPSNFSKPPAEFSKQAMAAKPVQSKLSIMALLSIIFGFLSLIFSCLAGIIGVILGIVALVRINGSQGRISGAGLAITGIILSVMLSMISGVLLGMLLPAVQQVRQAARQVTATNNMRQLVLAEHNHQSLTQKFSGTGLTEETGAGLSWRVHLLPYLEQQTLYEQFKLDEPWDSEHNKQLIPLMPEIYAAGLGSKAEGLLAAGQTTALRPVGNGAFPTLDDPKRTEGFLSLIHI